MPHLRPRPEGGISQQPYAVFRPVGGRIVPMVVAVISLLVFAGVAVALPSRADGSGAGPADRISILAIGLVLAGSMWRFAQVRAIPSTQGLEVHNLLSTRTVSWPEVVEVQFGGGAPWVTLELASFETLAVMGIQRADGARAQREAQRLAALVQAGSRPQHQQP